MIRRRSFRPWRGALIGVFMALPVAAHAQLVTTARVDLTGEVGYATNPFLSIAPAGANTDSGFATVRVAPSVAAIDERGRTGLRAYYSLTEYFRQYDSSSNYGGTLDTNRKLSEMVDVHALLDYDSAIIGSRDVFADTTIVDDIPLPDPEVDIGLIGARQRRETLRGSVGTAITPNIRDVWTIDLGAVQTNYPSNIAFSSDYVSYSAIFGYSRRLSESSMIGLNVAVVDTDYETTVADSRIYQPQLTYSGKLSEFWSITAGVGVSITERDTLAGKDSSVSPSFNLSACRRGARSNFCFGGAHSAQSSGFVGTQQQTSIYASYSYRFSERSDISANASYSRTSGGIGPFSNQELASFTGTYNRRLSERLRLTAGVGYRDVFRNVIGVDADISGRIGVAFTLGDLR